MINGCPVVRWPIVDGIGQTLAVKIMSSSFLEKTQSSGRQKYLAAEKELDGNIGLLRVNARGSEELCLRDRSLRHA